MPFGMSDDAITGLLVAAALVLPAGIFVLYWRQRRGFTRGAAPVRPCALRAWRGPVGLGWRQGFVKLSKDELSWRRRISFRSGAHLTVPRSSLTLRGRTRVDWQAWMWIAGADVLRLSNKGADLELGLFPHDADLLLEWLGTPADRPPRRLSAGVSVALWLLAVGAGTLFVGLSTERLWLFPALGVAAAIGGAVWGIVAWVAWRRSVNIEISKDDFVSTATEVFAFLEDFDFLHPYVQHFPWKTVVIFEGSDDRIVSVTNDRRNEVLELQLGHVSSGDLGALRDIVAAAGHPDPDRVTRYRGDDGPVRKALEANAHALRLWARDFLTEGVSAS